MIAPRLPQARPLMLVADAAATGRLWARKALEQAGFAVENAAHGA